MSSGGSGTWRWCSIAILIVGQVSSGLLVPYSRSSSSSSSSSSSTNGTSTSLEYPYDPSSVILASECIKFLIAFSFLLLSSREEGGGGVLRGLTWGRSLLSLVPAVGYCVTNNLVYEIFKHVDSATFLVTRNLSIVLTAFLSKVFFHKHFTDVQWAAVLLLALGATTSQLSRTTTNSSLFVFSFWGYGLCLLACSISSLLGVYFEMLAKYGLSTPPSSTSSSSSSPPSSSSFRPLHLQNIQIYFWSIVAAGVVLVIQRGEDMVREGVWSVVFRGYSFVTWALVFNYGIVGVATSVVLRLADTMVKVFTSTGALLLTSLLSSALFSHQLPALQVLLGIAVVSIALYLYFIPGTSLATVASSPSYEQRHPPSKQKAT